MQVPLCAVSEEASGLSVDALLMDGGAWSLPSIDSLFRAVLVLVSFAVVRSMSVEHPLFSPDMYFPGAFNINYQHLVIHGLALSY